MAPLKRIVEVRLLHNADGSVDRRAPLWVFADEGRGFCVNEPAVLDQLASDGEGAAFEAEWDGEWRFGRRVDRRDR